MADPVCADLGDAAREGRARHGRGACTAAAPTSASRARSSRPRRSRASTARWGVDVIGMTNMPEAKLAREAELCYATLALVTDYDVWHESHEAVTVEVVIAEPAAQRGDRQGRAPAPDPRAWAGRGRASARACCKNAVITSPAAFPLATRRRLDLLIGKYFLGEGGRPPCSRAPGLSPKKAASRTMADLAHDELDVVGIGNALVDVLSHARRRVPGASPTGEGRHAARRRGARGPALRGDGTLRGGLGRLRRQHDRGRGLVRGPRPLRGQGAQRRPRRRLRERPAPHRGRLHDAAGRQRASHGALPDRGHAGRAAHDEHLPRRLRAHRTGRRGRAPRRPGPHPLSRGLPLRSRPRPRRPSASRPASPTPPGARSR